MNDAQTYMLLAVIIILSAILIIKPFRKAAGIILRLCSGLFLYCAVSFVIGAFGVPLALNPMTAAASLLFGVPGVILIVLAHSLYL